jgi:hypothetical protein
MTSYSLRKVNIRQYLTNKKEPAELISDVASANQDVQSGIIKETYLRKEILRKLASKVRRGGRA